MSPKTGRKLPPFKFIKYFLAASLLILCGPFRAQADKTDPNCTQLLQNLIQTTLPALSDAKNLVAESEARFLKRFSETSGNKTPEEWFSAIRAGGDSQLKKTIDLLQSKDIELSIAVPSGLRANISEKGFLNQHAMGASYKKGANWSSAKTILGRNNVESGVLGISSAKYAGVSSDVKPKYGFLIPDAKNTGVWGISEIPYGDDRYIMKFENVKDRTTFTPFDSLNKWTLGDPEWNKRPVADNVLANNRWDLSYIPIEYRGLAATQFQVVEEDATKVLALAQVGDVTKIKQSFTPGNAEYIELQFWGPLDLNDVRAFEFKDNPPTGAYLAELLARKIEIRKRTYPLGMISSYEIYTPPASDLAGTLPFMKKFEEQAKR